MNKPTPPSRLLSVLAAMLCLAATLPAAAQQPDRASGTMIPGDTRVALGLTIHWEPAVGANPYPPQPPIPQYPGKITIQGPKTAIDLDRIDPQHVLTSPAFVLDGVLVELHLDVNFSSMNGMLIYRNLNLKYDAVPVKTQYVLTGEPFHEGFFVSREQPVVFGDRQLTISAEPAEYPDGQKHYELVVAPVQSAAETSGTAQKIPLIIGYQKDLGRLHIRVSDFTTSTGLAFLNVSADADSTPRGRATWIESFRLDNSTPLDLAVQRVAKAAGVEVRYDLAPLPQADQAQFQQMRFNIGTDGSDLKARTAEELIADLLKLPVSRTPLTRSDGRMDLVADWTDATHVTIRPSDPAAMADRARRQQLQEKLNQQIVTDYDNAYKPQLRVFQLKYMSAESAVKLITPQLGDLLLVKSALPGQNDRLTTMTADRFNQESAKSLLQVLRESRQSAVADPRTNSLIVSASPINMAKIAELIQELDSIVTSDRSKAPPDRTQLDVILLGGFKSGPQEWVGQAPDVHPLDEKQMADLGLSPADLKTYNLGGVIELSRGAISLVNEKGDLGRAALALAPGYRCELDYMDTRSPYLIVRGRLLEQTSDKPLLENTLFLEPGKPVLLGLTNLRQALILVVRAAAR